MINAGYGDTLDVAEVAEQQEMLRTFYKASVHHTAKVLQPHDERFDDMVQEGVVAAWQATQETRKDPVTYGAVSARNRINGMATGRFPMVGNEAEPGKRIHDLARQADRREDFEVTAEILDRGNPFVAVEQRVDMLRALRVLEPRDQRLAYLVGYHLGGGRSGAVGDPWETIAPAIGMAPLGARTRWTKYVRPALREALAAA